MRPIAGVLASAAMALGAMQSQQVQQARFFQDTIRNLRHPDAKVRVTAVETLGNAGYSAAAEAIAPLVTDPDDRVQFAAIDAEVTFFLIEPIGDRRIMSLGSSKSRAQAAFDAGPLVRMASPAPPVLIDHLITAMRDATSRIRFDATHALGVIAEPPLAAAQIRALLDQLDHYDPVIRAATARLLARLRVREAGDKLIAAMNDSNGVVQRCAVEALGLLREERAVASLLEFFRHYKKGDLAAESLQALARIGHASARDEFRARVTDSNAVMRRAAVEGLGRLGDRDSIGQLHAMVQADPSPIFRLAAAFAVWRLGEPRLPALVTAFSSPATFVQARDYLLEIGGPVEGNVRSALTATAQPRQRADLIHLLGFVGSREAVSMLEPFLKDKDPRVSRAAANAIARLSR